MAGAPKRRDPFAEIADLRSRFDRVLDDLGGHLRGAWQPAIDVMRGDDTLVVRADLPGLTPDEAKIEVSVIRSDSGQAVSSPGPPANHLIFVPELPCRRDRRMRHKKPRSTQRDGLLPRGTVEGFLEGMTLTLQMLHTSPADVPVEAAELATAIDACLTCVQACTACADSDLIEEDVVTLRACIAINLVCADICDATARVLSRPGQWDLLTVRDLLVACVRSCITCAEECDRHAEHHPHCAICSRACRACLRACTALLAGEAFPAPGISAAVQ